MVPLTLSSQNRKKKRGLFHDKCPSLCVAILTVLGILSKNLIRQQLDFWGYKTITKRRKKYDFYWQGLPTPRKPGRHTHGIKFFLSIYCIYNSMV